MSPSALYGERLVRATLSFSTQVARHIGAIKLFIFDYNLVRAGALHVWDYSEN
jgi:hypothetical protein